MKRLAVVFIFLHGAFVVLAQKENVVPDLSTGEVLITNLDEDTINYRDKASLILQNLRKGSVVVRLKTNEKSIEAYRKAGRDKVADRIESERKSQNKKMYKAFSDNFSFCKVYFIYANETEIFLKGYNGIFLNQNLEHDPSIIFMDTNFVFCEYGSVESFSKFTDYQNPVQNTKGIDMEGRIRGSKILDTVPVQTSTSPATTSGLFFSDKDLKQLHRPFPFVAGVYMQNYDAPVRALNREMERAYGNLVIKRYFRLKIKEEKKKQRLLLKQ